MGITSLMVALDYFIYDDKVGLVIIDYEMYQMDCDLANNIAETNTSIIMILVIAFNNVVNNKLFKQYLYQ